MRWVQSNAGHRSPSISHPALASMASAVDVMILAGHDENFYFNRLRRSSARLRPVTVIPLSSPAKRLHAYIADTRTRASDGSAVARSHGMAFTGVVKGLKAHLRGFTRDTHETRTRELTRTSYNYPQCPLARYRTDTHGLR